MSKQFKQTMIALSTAMAFGLPVTSHAIQGVHFDPDGTGGAAGPQIVDTFDWGAGAVLYENCFGLGGLGNPACTIYAQGAISLISLAGQGISIPAGVGFTFTLVTKATSSDESAGGTYDGFTPASGQSITFSDAADATSLFTIYKTNGAAPNALNGTGYTTADIVLQGRVSVTPDTFSVSNSNKAAPQNMDQNGANDFPGVTSRGSSGTPKFNIEVFTKDNAFFTDPLTLFTVSFSPDAKDTDNSALPFDQIDPSKNVAGQSFSGAAGTGSGTGTDGVDDIYCGTDKASAKGQTCSGEFQGDALTKFLTDVAPEPEMLALFGIGLAGLGAFSRRRKAAA